MKNGPGVARPDPDGLLGVDWGAGVARWGGEAAYRKALLGFVRRHAQDGALVRGAVERGDREGARGVVHAIKGGAAAVAAVGLEKAARELESALNVDMITTECSPEGLAFRIAAFESALLGMVGASGGWRRHEAAIRESERCGGSVPNPLDREANVGIGEMIDRLRLGRIQGVEEGLCALSGAGVVSRVDLARWLEMLEDLELESLLVALRRINPGGSS
ncbi:MAG: Hpt domain-containing protein [Magnetococcales bacterium]|nr:Hpt domain-containing protein [Magnetococcales bacterium]